MKRAFTASLFFVTSTTFAQFTSSLQFAYTHDSNVFGSFADIPDNYLTVNLSLDNYTGWDYSDLDLSYNGALASYNSYPEQDNWVHNVDATYRIQLSRVGDNMGNGDDSTSESGGSLLVPVDSLETYLTLAGAIAKTVPHSGDFSAYQNYIASGNANLRYPFGQTSVLRVAYGINYTEYDYISSLSNLENIGFANLSFYPSQNVVFYLDGSYGNKKYYGVDTVSTSVKNLIKMHSNGSYKGKGKGNGGTPPPSSSVKTYVLNSPFATQATYGGGLILRFGQWKANGSLLLRKDVSGNARYINAVAKFSSRVSAIYDDPYSYQGNEINLGVRKDSLLSGINVSVGLDRANKDYNRPAFNYTQTKVIAKQRHDICTDISIALSKEYSIKGVASGLTLGLNYDHIDNSSNDEFYNFTDDVITLSLGINLF